MLKITALLVLAFLPLLGIAFATEPKTQQAIKVLIKTNYGPITLELWPDKTPITVENFLKYVDSGYYNGTIFHRVIKDFMIQGGGFTEDLVQKKTLPPIVNEAQNAAKNTRGTIAMARTMDVNSATSQFFINLKDNSFLDFQNKTPQGYGYCTFGKVIDGMDVVDKIGAVATTTRGPYGDVPVKPVIIESVERL